jgi:hypothetical protein
MTLRLSILTSSTSSRSSDVGATGASLDQRRGEARAVNGVGRPAVGEGANQPPSVVRVQDSAQLVALMLC